MTVRILQAHTRIGDPHISSDDPDRLSILHALFEPLVRGGEKGTFKPCLATSWHLSSDARTWAFALREDVVFHDGEAMVADDVKRSLARIRDENVGGELGTQGVYQSYLAGSMIEAVGRHTVRLTTPEPMADLLDLLVHIPVLSANSLAQPNAYLGTGPYRLAGNTDDEVHLVRNDSYWGDNTVPEVLEWVAVANPDERLAHVLRQEADIVSGLLPAHQHRLAASLHAMALPVRSSVCATFMCNLLAGPCTLRPVRQALNYALDVPEIIKTVMHGAAHPITGPLTPHHLGFDPQAPGYTYDPQKARLLLKEAGYDKGLQLTLDVPEILPDEAAEVAARMAAYYSDVGIATTIVTHTDRPAYAEQVRAKQIHDAACFDSSPRSTFRILREKFDSRLRGPWWLGYDNPLVNACLDRARTDGDIELRRDAYQEAYRLLSADAPWIFLYNPIRWLGIHRRWQGWRPSPEGYIRFGAS